MFKAKDDDKQPSNLHHLAEMIAMLGHPPHDFLQRSKFASRYFDEDGHFFNSNFACHIMLTRNSGVGKWKGCAEIPTTSLEDSEENLEGENKALFLQFMRKMLQWKPEDRHSARDLLEDPWLNQR